MQWEEVTEIYHNGEIILYEMQVDPAEIEDVSYVNVSGSELVLLVGGLEEFVEHSFTVQAYTIAGPGSFSAVTISTNDRASE